MQRVHDGGDGRGDDAGGRQRPARPGAVDERQGRGDRDDGLHCLLQRIS